MDSGYTKGVALIFEGDTEKIFYLSLLRYYCTKHPGFSISKKSDATTGEVFYVLENDESRVLIKTNVVGTVSQLANSSAWFSSKCHGSNKSLEWTVILCYDTDEYMESFSKFHEGDWKELRKSLQKNKAKHIIDMAANADIEDTMLLDSNSIFAFLNMPICKIPSASKGKWKMKKLFRMKGPGVAYHEGERARPLIDALDFNVIINQSPLPFADFEASFFSNQ